MTKYLYLPGLGLDLNLCRSCSIVQPGEEYELIDYNEYNYQTSDPNYDLGEYLYQRFKNSLRLWDGDVSRDLNVIEIGCGRGFLINRLSTKYPNWDLTGIDPSEYNALFADKRFGIDIQTDFFEDVTIPPESVDIVICYGNLMLHEDPFGSIQKVARMLSEDGLFVCDAKNPFSTSRLLLRQLQFLPVEQIGTLKKIFRQAFHGFRFGLSENFFERLANEVGFKVLEIQDIPSRHQTLNPKKNKSDGFISKRNIFQLSAAVDTYTGRRAWIDCTYQSK
jgi:ubiquinone/menaquinone biosynthesis C-methylase UbiE